MLTRRRNKKLGPLEDYECQALVQWLDYMHIRYAHIANENKASDAKTAAIRGKQRKAMGVSPGVPDYMVVIHKRTPGGYKKRLLFIEMKRKGLTDCAVSAEQKSWIDELGNVEGVRAAVAFGLD